MRVRLVTLIRDFNKTYLAQHGQQSMVKGFGSWDCLNLAQETKLPLLCFHSGMCGSNIASRPVGVIHWCAGHELPDLEKSARVVDGYCLKGRPEAESVATSRYLVSSMWVSPKTMSGPL